MSMMDFLGGEEMSMNNDDLENNYNVGVQPSRSVVEENRVHGWCLLPKRTYDSIKQNEDESWREIINDHTLNQKSPGGNTVLHVAALYGNDRCVERIVEIGGAELLTAINRNGDTPLHVAARAGKISTLHMLVAALLPNPNSEQAKEAILVTNNQGNTLFHEAFLNGHKNVREILNSSPGFRELVEETAFTIKNNEDKSVLHLALEKGYEDIVVQVLFSRTVLPIQGDDENEDENEDEDKDEDKDEDEEKEEEEEEDKDGLETVEDKGYNTLNIIIISKRYFKFVHIFWSTCIYRQILHSVFERAYEDIADDVLTRIIPGMEEGRTPPDSEPTTLYIHKFITNSKNPHPNLSGKSRNTNERW